jgi:hypothetical protein
MLVFDDHGRSKKSIMNEGKNARQPEGKPSSMSGRKQAREPETMMPAGRSFVNADLKATPPECQTL